MTDVVDAVDGGDPSEWIRQLGVLDRQTGIERARDARQLLIDAAQTVLSAVTDYTVPHLIFSGFVARAQGLHEAAVAAIEADNPYAAFTLLRAYSENAAAILYLIDHPTTLNKFWQDPRGVQVGRITNHARKNFKMFKEIYDQLSQYAHPTRRSILASFQVSDDGQFTWSSAPRFGSEGDILTACAWVIELAQATSQLLRRLGATTFPST